MVDVYGASPPSSAVGRSNLPVSSHNQQVDPSHLSSLDLESDPTSQRGRSVGGNMIVTETTHLHDHNHNRSSRSKGMSNPN